MSAFTTIQDTQAFDKTRIANETLSLGHTKSTFELSTVVELLCFRALHQPKQQAYTFLVDGETEEANLTYEELDRRARAIGAELQSNGATGECALLLYPPGLDYIAAFFGSLYAGVIAVPAYPPRRNRPMPRLQAIVADSQTTLVLTTAQILSDIERRFAHAPDLKALSCLVTDTISGTLAEEWRDESVKRDTLAFLQYTSGSTGMPKGVMVSHGNLLHNSARIQNCFEHTPDSRGLVWLPPYHDMGLIGGILQPLFSGFPMTLIPPVAFLQKPFRWLRAISHYKATTSGGPNFAYDLCVDKITDEQRATLDLSSWDVAFNGAEPIRHETLQRFVATFEPCGFRREAFYPCYGMAEATLIVSGGKKTAPPVTQTLQKTALEQNRVTEKEGIRRLVGCGKAVLDQKIVIVEPESKTECPPDRIGEIWVSGPSVTRGYWNRIEETEQTFRAYLDTGEGSFLRTGDLGFIRDGELFVTGRLKDVIIIRGLNHYPQDIERTVEKSHQAVRPNCAAAFSVEVLGSERLIVVAEVERCFRRNLDVEAVISEIRLDVAAQHALQVYAVLLLRTGRIPKTSSGKIQRRACRTGFLEGTLDAVGQSVITQTKKKTIGNRGDLKDENTRQS